RLDRNIVSSMLDLMPSPRLIFHEWDRHGVCSGLPARAYFETIRKARATGEIPPDYLDLAEPKAVSPGEGEDAFIAANTGPTPGAIAVGCDAKRLREVRICLSKDLKFRDCADIDKRACRREQVVMPRVRGGEGGRRGRRGPAGLCAGAFRGGGRRKGGVTYRPPSRP